MILPNTPLKAEEFKQYGLDLLSYASNGKFEITSFIAKTIKRKIYGYWNGKQYVLTTI